MEIVFYNSLMKPKTFFGMPLIFLKGVFTIAGFMCFLRGIIPVQTTLTVTGICLFLGFVVFQGVKDKQILEIWLYNLGLPKYLGF